MPPVSTTKDALSPLAPPPLTAEPVVDATIVPEQDPRHMKFEEIKKLPDTDPQKYISLSALIEEFIAAGHNPRAPTDVMFQILGVTPEFLEGLLFSLKGQTTIKPGLSQAQKQPANDMVYGEVPPQVKPPNMELPEQQIPAPTPDTGTGT